MLRNPKYTGFNVWGRHDKRPGRPFIRPRDQWIWSPTPSHEPIVDRELFEQVEERAQRNNNPAKNIGPLDYPPRRLRRIGRIYPLRGRVRAAAAWKAVTRKAPTGTTAASSPSADPPPPTPAATPASWASRKRSSSMRRSTSSADGSSGQTASASSATSSRSPQAQTTASAKPSSCGSCATAKRSDVRSTGKRSASKNTTTPATPSSRSPRSASKNSAPAAAPSTSESPNCKPAQPTAPTAQQIEALLDSVPDLRPVMQQAPPDELSELFAAFDLSATYDKEQRALRLAATLTPELVPPTERSRPPKEAVGEIFHSGGRI